MGTVLRIYLEVNASRPFKVATILTLIKWNWLARKIGAGTVSERSNTQQQKKFMIDEWVAETQYLHLRWSITQVDSEWVSVGANFFLFSIDQQQASKARFERTTMQCNPYARAHWKIVQKWYRFQARSDPFYGKMTCDLLLLCKGLGPVGTIRSDCKCAECSFGGSR